MRYIKTKQIYPKNICYNRSFKKYNAHPKLTMYYNTVYLHNMYSIIISSYKNTIIRNITSTLIYFEIEFIRLIADEI